MDGNYTQTAVYANVSVVEKANQILKWALSRLTPRRPILTPALPIRSFESITPPKNQLWQCLLLIQTAHKSKLREQPSSLSLSLFTYYPHRNNGAIHHHLTLRDTSRIGLMYQIQSCYNTHNQPTPGPFTVPKCFSLKGWTHYAVSSVNPLFHTHRLTQTNAFWAHKGLLKILVINNYNFNNNTTVHTVRAKQNTKHTIWVSSCWPLQTFFQSR